MRALVRHLDRERLAVAGSYLAGWWMLLLANGRYWDDWVALDASAQVVSDWSKAQGQFWQWDLLRLLSSVPGTERLGHLLAFAAYLTVAVAFHRVLRAIPTIGARARTFLAIGVAVFPVNGARFAHIDLMYGISLAVFMVGWVLVTLDLERPARWRRPLAAGALLFAMLSTGSLLMFFAVIPLYIVWVWFAEGRDMQRRGLLWRRYRFLVALPVVAWAIRSAVLRPTGLYEGYNQVTASGLLQVPGLLPNAFHLSILQPLTEAFSVRLPWVLLGGVILYAIAMAARLLSDVDQLPSWRAHIVMLGAAAVTFVLAVTPYVAVNKMPQLLGWESRHQLLVPFAAALFLYASIMLLTQILRLGPRTALLTLCVLTSAFIISDVRISFDYQADWYKQVSLMKRMDQSPEFDDGRYFVFVDESREINAAQRGYAAYEFNGMMRSVFGDACRFGVDHMAVDVFDPMVMREYGQYNCWEYEPTPVRYGVTITHGEQDVTRTRAVLGLMWREVFAPDEFRERVADVVRIEVERLPDAE